MNYAILTRRFSFHSVILNKNICVAACSPFILHNSKDINHTKRLYSLQTTVEGAIKTQHGFFRTISESTPVEYLQNFVVNLHETTGLPWWATIMCSTILLRSIITAPVSVYQHIVIGKLLNVNSELMVIAQQLKKEVAVAMQTHNWNERIAKFHFNRSLKKQWNALVIRDNCHPAKTSILILVQIPLWVCFSVTLRNLVYMLPARDLNAHLIYSQLSTEGFGWIINLTQADHLFILPLMLGLINLTIIEVQALARVKEPSRLQRYLVNFFRCFSILMIPIAVYVPSGVTLFWTTSSAYGLIQNLIMMSPKVKRFCRIPHTPIELEKPYSHIYNNLKQRTRFIFGNAK